MDELAEWKLISNLNFSVLNESHKIEVFSNVYSLISYILFDLLKQIKLYFIYHPNINSMALVKTPLDADGSNPLPLAFLSTSIASLASDGIWDKLFGLALDVTDCCGSTPVAKGRILDLITSLSEFLSRRMDEDGFVVACCDESPPPVFLQK